MDWSPESLDMKRGRLQELEAMLDWLVLRVGLLTQEIERDVNKEYEKLGVAHG